METLTQLEGKPKRIASKIYECRAIKYCNFDGMRTLCCCIEFAHLLVICVCSLCFSLIFLSNVIRLSPALCASSLSDALRSCNFSAHIIRSLFKRRKRKKAEVWRIVKLGGKCETRSMTEICIFTNSKY